MNRFTIILGLILLMILGCEKVEEDKGEEEFKCGYIDFKYYQDKPSFFGEMSGDYLLIGSDTNNIDSAIESFIESCEYFDQSYAFDIKKYNNYKYKQIVLKLSKTQNCSGISRIISELKKNDIVDYAHYTIQTDDCTNDIWESIGEKCVDSYSSIFYVKVKDTNNLSDLNKTIRETNTIIRNQNKFMSDWYSLIADKNSEGDALQMANYFYETGLFEVSEPDIIKMVVE
jgi:hypothetical protein